jgi:hypothetical protein
MRVVIGPISKYPLENAMKKMLGLLVASIATALAQRLRETEVAVAQRGFGTAPSSTSAKQGYFKEAGLDRNSLYRGGASTPRR